jgi:hypothetical protein
MTTLAADRGECLEKISYCPADSLNDESFRDINHVNRQVRNDIIAYGLLLTSKGYRGCCYDVAHGYAANWINY